MLSAIDLDGRLTDLGKELAKYPLEPSYGKSLISSILMGCEDLMTNLGKYFNFSVFAFNWKYMDEDLENERRLVLEIWKSISFLLWFKWGSFNSFKNIFKMG